MISLISKQIVSKAFDEITKTILDTEKNTEDKLKEVTLAREQALKELTFEKSEVVAITKGLVRPVCTFLAMLWYMIARIKGIELAAEDYAIIGGILTFWFGFRPIEKKLNL